MAALAAGYIVIGVRLRRYSAFFRWREASVMAVKYVVRWGSP
jgi:hypothetical protein